MIRLQGVKATALGRVQARNRFYLITFESMCWRDRRMLRVIVALSTAVGPTGGAGVSDRHAAWLLAKKYAWSEFIAVRFI